jgi:hypothetical protein
LHAAQVLGYLRVSRLKHAISVNFAAAVIQFKKLIFNEGFHPNQWLGFCAF